VVRFGGRGHANRDDYAYVHADCNVYGYVHTDRDVYGYVDADSDVDCYVYADRDAYGNARRWSGGLLGDGLGGQQL
jgi:hypothetical protein